jgi:hypothetical protein
MKHSALHAESSVQCKKAKRQLSSMEVGRVNGVTALDTLLPA